MKTLMAISLLLVSTLAQSLAQNASPAVLTTPRFEQVALTVVDLNNARVFYRDQLGLRLMFEANNMLFFDVGGTRLMIARDLERQRSARPNGILYFHVEDFNASLDRLRASGTKLIGTVETVQSNNSGSRKLQQFEDTDGNMLAIMGFVTS
jgi:catechol-2,3-dioxygenase